MSGPVRRRLDLAVRIPMRGKIGSLNAAVAGSVLLFAAAGQRPAPDAGVAIQPATAEPVAQAAAETVPAKRASKSRKKVESAPKSESAVSESAPAEPTNSEEGLLPDNR
jgi:hypothetical protein